MGHQYEAHPSHDERQHWKAVECSLKGIHEELSTMRKTLRVAASVFERIAIALESAPEGAPEYVEIHVGVPRSEGSRRKRHDMHGSIALSYDKSVPFSLAVTDTKGKPVTTIPSGDSVVWSSSNESVATVETDQENDLNVMIRTPGVGTATITARLSRADGHTSEDTYQVTVTELPPSAVEIVPGTPVDEE